MRDMERDIIPMCVDQGMAIAPWGALGRGNFRSAEARKQAKQGGRQAAPMSDTEVNISDALDKIADTKSSTVTGVVCVNPHLLENWLALMNVTGNGICDAQNSKCLSHHWRP